jgi:adenosylcobinamide-phosphate synthase
MPTTGGALAVLVAFAADTLLGEPPAAWHPVVWVGRALSASGAPWPWLSAGTALRRGALVWCAGACVTVLAAVMVFHAVEAAAAAAVAVVAAVAPTGSPGTEFSSVLWRALLSGLVLGLLLKPLLAWRLLHDEVAAVEKALIVSLEAGRARLSRLVSRDTAHLTAVEVRESALESLAENLNDSFVAPLFWFAVGGLPAAALYRFANTADAMWGYRGRWEWAGKWSARADDVLSYVPARLTALLLAMVSGSWPRALFREARLTPSPNGGWPMAMMALALEVRLSKPGAYVLNAGGRPAVTHDMQRGLRLARRAVWLAVGGTVAAVWAVARVAATTGAVAAAVATGAARA